VSDELVVDASAMMAALSGQDAVAIEAGKRIAQSTCHAPHLIDVEIGSVLRKAERRGSLTSERAAATLRMSQLLVDERYTHKGWLSAAAWDLRHNVSFYDAMYAALAARLSLPMLTADARLANAPGLPCQVELIV